MDGGALPRRKLAPCVKYLAVLGESGGLIVQRREGPGNCVAYGNHDAVTSVRQ